LEDEGCAGACVVGTAVVGALLDDDSPELTLFDGG
jgi:hypothetical protein